MRDGVDNYDATGRLNGPAGTGMAMVLVWDRRVGGGHAVLAYSAQNTETGGFKMDVWDNNFPRQTHTITVDADGDWRYDAPYRNGFLQGERSLAGSAGIPEGDIAILPLYHPSGLHYLPQPTGGLGTGTMLDVPAGTVASDIVDSGSAQPLVRDITSEDEVDHVPSGQIITLPRTPAA